MQLFGEPLTAFKSIWSNSYFSTKVEGAARKLVHVNTGSSILGRRRLEEQGSKSHASDTDGLLFQQPACTRGFRAEQERKEAYDLGKCSEKYAKFELKLKRTLFQSI